MNSALVALRGVSLHVPYTVLYAVANRRCTASARRILLVRHPGRALHYYDYILSWLGREFPNLRSVCELALLPRRLRDPQRYALVVPWLQDPVEDWSPRAYRRALELMRSCHEHHVPVINPVDVLSRAAKSAGATLIGSTGIRTPRVASIGSVERIPQVLDEIGLPALIREDRGHGGTTFLVRSRQEIREIPWRRFRHPIAMEFIDVQSPRDGRYRKYRYFAAGDTGVPRHLIMSRKWEVRPSDRLKDEAARREELDYLQSPDPNHVRLQRAREILGLDVVALDYSYDRDGQLVVWEANPFPTLNYPKSRDVQYLFPFVERSFAALFRFYLIRGGLPVPDRLEELLGVGGPELGRGPVTRLSQLAAEAA